MLELANLIFKVNGIKGFYTGVQVRVLRSTLFGFLMIGMYENLLILIDKTTNF